MGKYSEIIHSSNNLLNYTSYRVSRSLIEVSEVWFSRSRDWDGIRGQSGCSQVRPVRDWGELHTGMGKDSLSLLSVGGSGIENLHGVEKKGWPFVSQVSQSLTCPPTSPLSPITECNLLGISRRLDSQWLEKVIAINNWHPHSCSWGMSDWSYKGKGGEGTCQSHLP